MNFDMRMYGCKEGSGRSSRTVPSKFRSRQLCWATAPQFPATMSQTSSHILTLLNSTHGSESAAISRPVDFLSWCQVSPIEGYTASCAPPKARSASSSFLAPQSRLFTSLSIYLTSSKTTEGTNFENSDSQNRTAWLHDKVILLRK